jgi:hypothetical protein
MKILLLLAGLLVSALTSQAQVATPTRKGVVQVGKGLNVAVTTGLLSLSATQTTLPQGTLYDFGTMKLLLISSVVNSSSKSVVNLTADNSATGTAIFSNVLHATATGWKTGTQPTDVLIGTPEPVPAGNKTLTVRWAAGNVVVIGGGSMANAPTNTPVTIAVLGN